MIHQVIHRCFVEQKYMPPDTVNSCISPDIVVSPMIKIWTAVNLFSLTVETLVFCFTAFLNILAKTQLQLIVPLFLTNRVIRELPVYFGWLIQLWGIFSLTLPRWLLRSQNVIRKYILEISFVLYMTNVHNILKWVCEKRHDKGKKCFLCSISPVVFLLVGILNCKYVRIGNHVCLVVNYSLLCSSAFRHITALYLAILLYVSSDWHAFSLSLPCVRW